MMTVVGEEGTSIADFTIMLKAEFFDNVYLQQNAFDPVDGATPKERQQLAFDKVLEVLKLEIDFETKDEARRVMFELQDLFRTWNYAAADNDEYTELLGRIDQFIANGDKIEETAV